MSDQSAGVPPTIDNVHVGAADLAVEPETWKDRLASSAKAVAALLVGGAALGGQIATGEQADVGLVDAGTVVLTAGIVWLVRNR